MLCAHHGWKVRLKFPYFQRGISSNERFPKIFETVHLSLFRSLLALCNFCTSLVPLFFVSKGFLSCVNRRTKLKISKRRVFKRDLILIRYFNLFHARRREIRLCTFPTNLNFCPKFHFVILHITEESSVRRNVAKQIARRIKRSLKESRIDPTTTN